MNTYIVLDLEWNQCPNGKVESVERLPFEIIEIGAIKLDRKFNKLSEFQRIVKPVVYDRLHFHVSEVVHLGIRELRKNGIAFAQAAQEFLDWAYMDGEKPVFCTWGEMDLTQFQRNMEYHNVSNPFPYPFLYYDIQKLYAILGSGSHKVVPPLDKAIEELGIEKNGEFHRALDDASYTAMIMQRIDIKSVYEYKSTDYYRIPENGEEEVYLTFPTYTKYISRPFETKEQMMSDRTVTDMLCPRCNRKLRKKIRWFSGNQKQYLCVAACPQHGFAKGKIRVKKDRADNLFAVKTIKLIDSSAVDDIAIKRDELKRVRREKLIVKKCRQKESSFLS